MVKNRSSTEKAPQRGEVFGILKCGNPGCAKRTKPNQRCLQEGCTSILYTQYKK